MLQSGGVRLSLYSYLAIVCFIAQGASLLVFSSSYPRHQGPSTGPGVLVPRIQGPGPRVRPGVLVPFGRNSAIIPEEKVSGLIGLFGVILEFVLYYTRTEPELAHKAQGRTRTQVDSLCI